MADNILRTDADPLAFLAGGGEMGERTRAFDWSATPLGEPASWPQGLQAAVSICLNSRFPIVLWWGPELRLIYNDAWRPVLGQTKHPQALGSPGRVVWPEIWHIIGPMLEGVIANGKATWSDDQLLPLDRNGYLEEAYFTYSYSPILGNAGKIGGVFAAVNETTQRVIGERRLKTLRGLAAQAAITKSGDEAGRAAVATLAANPSDVPFALVYLLSDDQKEARLCECTGLPTDHPARPQVVSLTGYSLNPIWPLGSVLRSGRALIDLDARHGELPTSSWPVPPQKAVLLPLMASGQDRMVGVLVLGVNPGRELDDEHQGFHDLVAGHVATAIANARAYEDERRRAESLAELDRAKTAFFSNVSHEFRTPLTLMLGPVEDALAGSDGPLPPSQRERLEVVHRNGLRLQRLVNSLLDFSRIEAGRVRAAYEPTALAEFTADLASNFRSACEKAGLRLVVDCPPLGEPVYVDHLMWEKVVLNLLSNAFKFTFDGEIAVSMRQADHTAELRVQDTGTGIPGDEMPRLFERFHRVENARGRTHEGSGIGLALVHELLKLHGGLITVESEVGRGTTFIVTVPLGSHHLPREQVVTGRTTAVTTAGAIPFVEEALRWLPENHKDLEARPDVSIEDDYLPVTQTVQTEGDRPRVLVADDNADMRRYVVRLLSGSYTVEAVTDGAAALDSVRRQAPDLILSDVMMPRLDGFGLLRRLRGDPTTATVPVILLSARAGEESRVEGMEAGADDYLVKPFSARELLARVGSLLQIARLRRESEQAIRASEEHLRAVVETTPACIKIVSADGTLVAMNSAGLAMVDAERTEEVYGACVYGLICAEYRDAFRQFNERVCRGESGTMEFEIEGLRGTKRRMETHAAPLRGPDGSFRQLAITHDITDRKRAESLQSGQRAVLEMIARGAPLPDVLASVCRLIEDQEPGLLCSILLTDDTGRHTGTGYGPSLPDEFVRALQGINIAPPHVGSCCKALDCGQEVLVADIENDNRWSPLWRDLNLQFGLRACRSIPIHGSDGTVLASVAVFRRQPGDPGPSNKQLLGIATHLAGVAIERRRAEDRERQLLQKAATANAQFRAFFEQGALFAGIMHTDGRVIETNRLAVEACGFTREQVVGEFFWDCPWWNRSPDLMRRIKDATAQAAAGEAFRAEMPYFVAGGGERMVDFILLPIKDESGRVMFLAPTGTDITDRRRAEEAAHKQSEQLRQLAVIATRLNAADVASITGVVTEEARTLIGSHQAVTGFTVDQNWAQSINRVSLSEKYAAFRGYEAKPDGSGIYSLVCRTNKPLRMTQAELEKHPAYKWFGQHAADHPPLRGWLAAPLVGQDGRNIGLIQLSDKVEGEFTAEDEAILVQLAQMASVAIENARLVQDLRDADRRKDEFLATLAHELRNPLAPLRNGLQVLRLGGATGEMADNARTMMERQLGQMVHLIDDLLDLSRISRGKIKLRKERVELSKVVQQAVETSRPLIEANGHDLTITMPPGPVYVDADVTRMAQVFSNLLNNAAKYTERGGRVQLGVQRRGGEAVVSVKDNGVGIPAHMLPKVFEMFTQVDRNLERAQGGLGIGLSIVKRLVEMHGGSVSVQSDGPGMGSEFVVRLPVVLSVAQPNGGDEEPARPSSGRRVLVVDDNVDAAMSLAMMLKLMGNEAKTAHDGLEALDVAAAYRPDLILLDIGMPRLNGHETARRIREQPWGRNMMLIALTGWGQEEDRRKSEEAGFDSHMVKPVDPVALEKLLATLKADTA